ncbi:hypothetical protein niasHS_011139 [Heterodera schachtii]|uniref:C3H1-type domain-containing protein n=1 Tax=Heterodera schachtii TaxID=97005 RepID=A0ABD2IW27_HETSC
MVILRHDKSSNKSHPILLYLPWRMPLLRRGYTGRFHLIYPDSQKPVPLSHYVNGPPAPILLPMEQQTKFSSIQQPKPLPKLSHHQPNNNTNNNKRPADYLVNEKYKTILCKSFTINGYCAYGAQCLFAHGEGELRNQKFKKCW